MEPIVVIDNELLEEYALLSTFFSPSNTTLGVLILGENYHEVSRNVILRVYRLNKETDGKFYSQAELQVFSFSSFNEAEQFLSYLPEMSALELILMMEKENLVV
ncbi:hypothetical protein D8M04_13525 [Oceanobacillus piezotolerans]|uniref:Uncharacterized protein n=1 Tax=Oceanobacillus piezotolerans TaxID=2448030 RepID=A0A498DLR2_9BACI|nr:hypothetical protein [Oceanobacillus piezotolerans]RLL43919.1 hypothetical protein D8M04_13525 [Oceanobacillus piezotolerans]